MSPSDKCCIIDELEWHCRCPRALCELLTESEAKSILKRGFVSKELLEDLRPRIDQVESK